MKIDLQEEFTIEIKEDYPAEPVTWGYMLRVAADYLRDNPDVEVVGVHPSSPTNGKRLRLTLTRTTNPEPR